MTSLFIWMTSFVLFVCSENARALEPHCQRKLQPSYSSLSGQIVKQAPRLRVMCPPRRSNPAILRHCTGPGTHQEEAIVRDRKDNTVQGTLGYNRSWQAWPSNDNTTITRDPDRRDITSAKYTAPGLCHGRLLGALGCNPPWRQCTRQLQDNYKTTTRQCTRQSTRQLKTPS